MTGHLTRIHPRGVARLRHHVAGFLEMLECGCVGGARIDGTCTDCGAPSS
jgi:hypothetical protein